MFAMAAPNLRVEGQNFENFVEQLSRVYSALCHLWTKTSPRRHNWIRRGTRPPGVCVARAELCLGPNHRRPTEGGPFTSPGPNGGSLATATRGRDPRCGCGSGRCGNGGHRALYVLTPLALAQQLMSYQPSLQSTADSSGNRAPLGNSQRS